MRSHLYDLNLADMDGAERLVSQLVRLDRLPAVNPFEGLLLLREAWCDYDVAMLLATRYKRVCKILFALQLTLAWLVITGSAFRTWLALRGDYEQLAASLSIAVSSITVAITALISIDTLLSSQPRWRQLRSAAGSLNSLIWYYRTRLHVEATLSACLYCSPSASERH